MIFIILIAFALILLGGFLLLVSFERTRGLRIAGKLRNTLDAKVARAAFVATHVDWGAFVKHLAGTAAERIAHDIAHGILQIVRITERFLTRAVKYLRARRGLAALEDVEHEASSRFQAGLKRVRTALRNARAASRKPVSKKGGQ